MTHNYYGKGFLLFIFIGSATMAYHYLRVRNKKKPPRRHQINEVLMFTEPMPTETYQSEVSQPVLHPSTDRLLYYLSLTEHTLDICMYMITSLDLACQILDLHHKGVKIRLIVEADMAYAPASTIKLFEKQGIEVRLATEESILKNFCLVDGLTGLEESEVLPFLIFGSLTWTKEALQGSNDEIVFVTSRILFVRVFKEEFERLYVEAI